mmetsp:Transcript_50123/g.93798  ORF Transcript_50123/g.93798 Transcript_50123/m.93798 type:complete len:116 (-) Transcript_50123:2217-2564(-)
MIIVHSRQASCKRLRQHEMALLAPSIRKLSSVSYPVSSQDAASPKLSPQVHYLSAQCAWIRDMSSGLFPDKVKSLSSKYDLSSLTLSCVNVSWAALPSTSAASTVTYQTGGLSLE